jgi:hypothetical protein
MTQPRRILWFTFAAAALLLMAGRASAQTYVTPNVAPTPPGKLIVVNNATGATHDDPHVSGDLVSYSNSDGTNFTIRYFNLATGVDAGVPNNGTLDFLSDVRGSVIVFARLSSSASAIFAFDTANPSSPPVEIAPQSSVARQSPQIGDQTIAWEDSSAGTISDIVALDRQSGTTTRLTNDSVLNLLPHISPDGKVIVWEKCTSIFSTSIFSLCPTWKATLSNGSWTAQQVISQLQPGTQQPGFFNFSDTDGAIIAYTGLNPQGISQLAWQPVGGGIENVLNLSGGNAATPSVSGGPQNSLIAFSYLPAGASVHDLALYNPARNVLYNITGDLTKAGLYPLADNELNDISVTTDGKVRVVWQASGASLDVFAYTFNLPVGDFNLGGISPMTISAGGSGFGQCDGKSGERVQFGGGPELHRSARQRNGFAVADPGHAVWGKSSHFRAQRERAFLYHPHKLHADSHGHFWNADPFGDRECHRYLDDGQYHQPDRRPSGCRVHRQHC